MIKNNIFYILFKQAQHFLIIFKIKICLKSCFKILNTFKS